MVEKVWYVKSNVEAIRNSLRLGKQATAPGNYINLG